MSSMMQLIIVNYEAMKKFQNSFRGQETATQQTIGKLTKVIEQLRGGDWIGEGANQFFQEMDGQVIPALKRLQNAMTEGDKVSKDIEKIQHETESQITSLFKDILSKFAEG
jgi:WXG100 family type VII secretion target